MAPFFCLNPLFLTLERVILVGLDQLTDIGRYEMTTYPEARAFEKFHYEAQPYDVADLINVTWHPYGDNPEFNKYNPHGDNGYIIGTVVKGSTFSRLFHATSTQQWSTNVEKRLDYIPLRHIRFDDEGNGTYISATCG